MLILTIIQPSNTTSDIYLIINEWAIEVLVKINVASLTGCNNFDRGHPLVLILTIAYIYIYV